jgi:hypothetical protein
MRRIYMEKEWCEFPADVRDGEVLEIIRRGGPRDGDSMGYGRIATNADGSVGVHWTVEKPVGAEPSC